MSLTPPALAGGFFTTSATWEAPLLLIPYIYFLGALFELLIIQQRQKLLPIINLCFAVGKATVLKDYRGVAD